jgi:hypothetical protein
MRNIGDHLDHLLVFCHFACVQPKRQIGVSGVTRGAKIAVRVTTVAFKRSIVKCGVPAPSVASRQSAIVSARWKPNIAALSLLGCRTSMRLLESAINSQCEHK